MISNAGSNEVIVINVCRSALQAFKRRVAYSNVAYDRILFLFIFHFYYFILHLLVSILVNLFVVNVVGKGAKLFYFYIFFNFP